MGAMCSIMSARPPKAPTGMPPPMIFASVVRSGRIPDKPCTPCGPRSEEHTSELQSLMRISYAVFCLKKKKKEQLPKHRAEKIDTQPLVTPNINAHILNA